MERILENVYKDALSKLQASTEDGTPLVNAVVDIVIMSDIVRNKGLLGLEEFAGDHVSSFTKWIVMLIADGTDYDIVAEMAVNEYWMRASKGISAMIDYIYIRGLLCVQEGWNNRMLINFLQTLIPFELRQEYQTKLAEYQAELNTLEEKRKKEDAEKFAKICPVFQDETIIGKIQILENKFRKFSVRNLQRVLREVDSRDMAMCIYAMPKEVQKKILDSLSSRLVAIVIKEVVCFSPIDEQEVLKSIEKALRIINKLSERGEIYEPDE